MSLADWCRVVRGMLLAKYPSTRRYPWQPWHSPPPRHPSHWATGSKPLTYLRLMLTSWAGAMQMLAKSVHHHHHYRQCWFQYKALFICRMKLRWLRKTGSLDTSKLWRKKKRNGLQKKRMRSCTPTHARKPSRLKRINQNVDLDPTAGVQVKNPQLQKKRKRTVSHRHQVMRLQWLSGTVAMLVALHPDLVAEAAAVVALNELQEGLSFLMKFSFCFSWNGKKKLVKSKDFLSWAP